MSSPPDMTSPPDDPEMPPFKGPPIPQLRGNEGATQPLSFRQSKSLSYRLRNTDIFAETLRRKITSNGTTSVNWRYLGVECGKCFNAIPTRAFPLWCAQPRDGSLNDEGGSKQGGEGDGILNDEGGSKQGGEEGGNLLPGLPPLPPIEELYSPFDQVITSPILTSSGPSLLRQLCATTHEQLHQEVTPSQALMELSDGWNNEETIEGWASEYKITFEPPSSDLKIRENKREESWDLIYLELRMWLEEHNNCYPKRSSDDANEKKLSVWCCNQRQLYNKGVLKQGRETKLNAINFAWDKDATSNLSNSWNDTFVELETWLVEHNNSYPNSKSQNSDESKLGRWVSQQRLCKKNETLSEEREAKLNTINFAWDRYATSNLSNSWNDKFVELETWLAEHNNSYPNSKSENSDESKLAAWINEQRVKKKRGTLNEERETKLNTINFAWDRYATSNWSKGWDDKFVEFKTWLAEHNNVYPRDHSKDINETKLARWAYKQRGIYKKGELNEEREMKLNEIDFFAWDRYSKSSWSKGWDDKFVEFKTWLAEHNNVYPRDRSKDINETKLARRAYKQRGKYKKGQLKHEREMKLNEIDFKW